MKAIAFALVVALAGVGVAAVPVAGALPDPVCNEDYPEVCAVTDAAIELVRCLAQQGPCPH